MLDYLVRLWRVDDDRSSQHVDHVDVVVAVSYGVRRDGTLTRGTRAVDELARDVFKESHASILVYGVFTHSADPDKEVKCRAEDFRFLPLNSTLCVGTVASTIQEAERVSAALKSAGHLVQSLIIVTGACHSRTARWVWKQAFPHARIFVISVPFDQETDPENPVMFLRKGWTWFGVNIARHFVFRMLRYRIARKLNLRQPTLGA